jgi:hypothetical protein
VADVARSTGPAPPTAFAYAVKPGQPGNSEITVMDVRGKSALVALHVLKASSKTCRLYREADAVQ